MISLPSRDFFPFIIDNNHAAWADGVIHHHERFLKNINPDLAEWRPNLSAGLSVNFLEGEELLHGSTVKQTAGVALKVLGGGLPG